MPDDSPARSSCELDSLRPPHGRLTIGLEAPLKPISPEVAAAMLALLGGAGAWGTLTGSLSAQTDLVAALALKAPLAAPTFTGVPAAPTAVAGTNTTQLATTAFVGAAITAAAPSYADATATTAALALKAPLGSPALTGTPTAPTAGGGTNTTQLATTAFVKAAIDALIGGAGSLVDTLGEIAAIIASDESAASALATAVAGKQAVHANLTAISGLTNAADKVIVFTGSGATTQTVTSFAFTLLDDTTAADMRNTLGLGTSATQSSNSFEANHGNPVADGYVLSSTAAGVRSWVPPGSGASWGAITGTLADQTDLQAALDAKADASSLGTGAFASVTSMPKWTFNNASHSAPGVLGLFNTDAGDPVSTTAILLGGTAIGGSAIAQAFSTLPVGSKLCLIDGAGVCQVFRVVLMAGSGADTIVNVAFISGTGAAWAGEYTVFAVPPDDSYYDAAGAAAAVAATVPTADSGWTANADVGDKTAVVPAYANAFDATMESDFNAVSAGAGTAIKAALDALVPGLQKVKALEVVAAANQRPNA